MYYLKELRDEFPEIKAFDEDDFEWIDEANEFIRKGKIKKAEELYKKLCLSQPEHFDGFLGVARICYERSEQEKALWFMKQAVKKAKAFLTEDAIDEEVIDLLEGHLESIKEKRSLKYDYMIPPAV